LKEALKVATLFSYFADVFSLGLAVEEQLDAASGTLSVPELNAQLDLAVKSAHDRALAGGKREKDVLEAAFAIVAWVDELVTRRFEAWAGATSLQKRWFDTALAGNDFFSHLQNLTTEQAEVREIYYLVLCLGFRGQYFFETGEGGELGRLKDLHSRQLPVKPAAIHTLREEKITPQPYLMDDPAGVRLPGKPERRLLWIAVAIALLLPIGYAIWQLVVQPKGPTLQQQVAGAVATFSCADLSARVDNDEAVSISGFVSKADDIARLKAEMGKLTGVKQLNVDLSVRIWPYCEVVELLKPYKERNDTYGFGLAVQPSTGHSDSFIENERVTVDLRQSNTDGYIYVDYYVIDGTVIHLLPNSREPASGHAVPAGGALRLGEINPPWLIGPPFGQELITIVSSPVPLYQGELPQTEPAADYLPRLRQMIEARAQEQHLSANFLFLQTQAAKLGASQ
jgi:type IV/VI secretion system ImpK/VasF family protein